MGAGLGLAWDWLAQQGPGPGGLMGNLLARHMRLDIANPDQHATIAARCASTKATSMRTI